MPGFARPQWVAPAILQKLMRYAGINTTMGCYRDLDVDEMTEEPWANHHPAEVKTGLPGNNGQKSSKKRRKPRNRK